MKKLSRTILLLVSVLGIALAAFAITPEIERKAEQADRYYVQGNYAAAFPLMKEAAEGGDEISMYTLATMYYSGQGTSVDMAKARYWWQKCADLGDTEAAAWVRKIDAQQSPDSEVAYKSVEQMPMFPGGDAALMKWLSSHTQYPVKAQENNIQGRVVVRFVVTKTGDIGEIEVIRSVDPDLDKEAVRVCKSLPRFNPGRKNGEAVDVWFSLPVSFFLNNTKL